MLYNSSSFDKAMVATLILACLACFNTLICSVYADPFQDEIARFVAATEKHNASRPDEATASDQEIRDPECRREGTRACAECLAKWERDKAGCGNSFPDDNRAQLRCANDANAALQQCKDSWKCDFKKVIRVSEFPSYSQISPFATSVTFP